MLTIEEVRQATAIETLFLKPGDFHPMGSYTLKELHDAGYAMAMGTEVGMIFVRSRLRSDIQAEEESRLKRVQAITDKYMAKAEKPALAAGSVVQLKSGSTRMTVADIKDGRAFCVWFGSNGPCERAYPFDALVVV